jgi:hypothetical protein
MSYSKKNNISCIEWILILASLNCITVSILIGLLLNCKTLNCWLSGIITLNIQTFLVINSFRWNTYKRNENIDSHYIMSYMITIIFSALIAVLYVYQQPFDIYTIIYMLSITQVAIIFDIITYHSVNNMRNIKTD